MMTKAERILELYGKAISTVPKQALTQFVAAQVGTTASYVRTVARQRIGRGISEAERRYVSSPLGRATRRRANSAYQRRRYHSDPEYRAKRLAKRTLQRQRAKRRAEARAS